VQGDLCGSGIVLEVCWVHARMDVEDYYFVVVIVLFRERWY
jgi:hypothetical protein